MSKQRKVAVVTGSARGIGRAIAEEFAARGIAVLVHAGTDATEAEAVAERLRARGARASATTGDLAATGQIERLFDFCAEQLGQPDIVVANAGIFVGGPLLEVGAGDYDRLFAVNTRAAFFTMQEGARRLRDGGRIVALSTSLTRVPRDGTLLYAASKAAVEQFVRGFARELGPRGITVNAVAPASTHTRMASEAARKAAAASSPLGRAGEPEDIADVVGFLVSDQARWLTGQIIGASGGVAM